MGRLSMRRSLRVTGAVVALAVFAGAAYGQSAVFAGKVTTLGQPLGGASVGIPEFGVGSVTAPDGRYNFTVDVSRGRGRSVQVVARYIGYKPKTMVVTLAAGRVDKDFELEKDILNLEQVVVTGVSGATSQKNTAFAVAALDASQLKEAPSTSPLGGLEGKIAGASVVTTSGQPGAEPAIRLRAATSITGRQDPLVIVDGTITRLGLADINSEDIERVEVTKGAAASALYGSDAANGVIQIFTKRGAHLAEGQTSFTLRNEFGSSYLPRKVAVNQSNEWQVDAKGAFILDDNGNRIIRDDKISKSPYPVVYDQLSQVFKPGQFMTNYVSVGQRRGSTNFNASFQNVKESGVLTLLNGYARQNFRVNIDQSLGDKLDFSTGAFYGRSTSDQGEDHGLFFGMRFLEPNVNLLALNKDGSPYNAAIKQPPLSGNVVNPLYNLSTIQVNQDRDRFTGTFKLRYRPFDWLTAEGNVNYDESNQNYKSLTPLGFLNSSGGASKGDLRQIVDNNRQNNMGATLTSYKAWSWITNTTKIAYVFEDQKDTRLSVNATALSVPRIPEFTAAVQDPAFPIQPGSFTDVIRNQNIFAVTTFDFNDRYILDGLVRKDESSLFGKDSRSAIYQRLSGAWRVSQDLRIRGIDEFKLRASYGTAGLRPQFDAQYETFAITNGSPSKQTLGNRLLKPAYSREQEFGFNLNFLRNYTLDYSYSNKVTSDQIMSVPLSAAAGYQNQWKNAGTLAGQTHEVAFGAILVSKADYFLRLNITADRTRSKITKLNVAPFLAGPNPNDANTQIFRIAAGQPFGVIYGSRWIRTADQLTQTLASGKLTGAASDYVVNQQGYYVAKSALNTVTELPLKAYLKDGTSVVEIGDVNPDFNLGSTITAHYKALSVNAVVSWVKGGQIYNYTRQWPFNEHRDAIFDQRNVAAGAQKPVTYFDAFYNNFDPNEFFVEDGTYLRLRELNVSWELPRTFVKSMRVGSIESVRIALVGRNLWTRTKYSGYDPDVTGPGGGNPFGYRVDYFTYPAYRTVTAMLEIGY
jgi:TonB-linked SusC/RagA family outer membrane protein